MSRLDSFLRRMMAQRACLDAAAELVNDLLGPALELGLGDGRTYDHLRRLMPGREIYVFERELAAPADYLPPLPFLVLGDGRETLPLMSDRLTRSAVLAHFDMGSGVSAANDRLAAEIAPLLVPLMRSGAVVASNRPLDMPDYSAISLPMGIEEGRYHLYRVR
jgi:S-adenosyl-L-methionine methyltransferase